MASQPSSTGREAGASDPDNGRRSVSRSAVSREQILHALRSQPGLSQIGLVRQLQLSQATVSVAVGELLAAGMVVSTGREQSTGGRRAERLALNPERPLTLGLDFGEADAQLGVVNLEGRVIDIERITFRRDRRRVLIEPLIDAATSLLDRQPDVRGVGIAVPGIVSRDGYVRNAANLGWRELPIRAEFEAALGLPTIVDRNTNAALLGEQWWGSLDADPFVFVTLGSGVGAGLRVNRAFVHGASETAGEFGHLTVDPGGARCRCGRQGCLETRASAGALVQLYDRLVRESGGVRARGRRTTVSGIAAAAADGDPIARRAITEVADWLAAGLIALITLLNPRVLMLGGELMAAQEILLPRVRATVRANGPRLAKEVADIVPSTFGDRAAVVGAAALAFDAIFRNC